MSCHDGTPAGNFYKQQALLANALDWKVITYEQLLGAALTLGLGSIADDSVRTLATYEKFSQYILKEGATHGKDAVFRSLGYTRQDSYALANMWQSQADAKFGLGQYSLGKLDQFGQRINIEIELRGIGNASGNTSYIQSGWMIQKNGSINLNTPFAGFTK